MKRLALVACALAALPLLADDWLHTVKITIEPPDDGQQILNIRFTPAKTVTYDQLIFECVYHQQFAWHDERGKPTVKVLEPVVFIYRRAQARMVDELDFNASFRAPVSYARLTEAFGANTFATNAPIIVDRLRIYGERGDARLWEQELKVPGTYVIVLKAAPPPPPPPPKTNKFGEVNLD